MLKSFRQVLDLVTKIKVQKPMVFKLGFRSVEREMQLILFSSKSATSLLGVSCSANQRSMSLYA